MPQSIYDRYRQLQQPTSTRSIYDRWSGAEAPTPEDEESGVLDTVLDVLSTPGRMTAGTVRAIQEDESIVDRILANRPTALGGTLEDDFDDVLAETGMEDTLMRRGLGLALDVAVDPLNFIPIAPAVKAGARLLSPVTDAVRGSRLGRDVAERFVPYSGLDKFTTTVAQNAPGAPAGGRRTVQEMSYQDMRRLHQSTRDAAREARGREVLELFKGITNDEAFEIAKALDEGYPLPDPRLDSLRAQAAKIFDAQFGKETTAGVMGLDRRITNYAPHLLTKEARQDPTNVRALTGRNPFQARKEMTLEQGVNAGVFEPDIRKSMSVRLATGDRAILDQEFFLKTAKMFGVKAKKGVAPKGYVRPNLAGEPGLKKALRGVYVPAEIARDLEKMIELPKQAGPLAEMATGATALWKGYATRANPGFHVRNAVSNMLQTWFGGLGETGLKVLDPAIVLAKHVQAARLLGDPSKIGQVGAYNGDEIRAALDQYGVLGGAHTSFNELDDIIEGEIKHAGQGVIRRNLNPLDRRNALLRAGAAAGNSVENTSRLALFLDQVEKGKTLEQAALHVRKYLFDYSELTDFERKVRDRALPFYTWLRKNIPLQVDNVLNRPDQMAVLGKGFDAVEDTGEDRGLALSPDQVPEWMRDYIQLPTETDEGAAVFVNPSLPVQDLNKLAPSVERDVLSALNPLVRIPLELSTNRSFFTQGPLYDERLGAFGDYRRAPDALQVVNEIVPGTLPESERGAEIPVGVDYALRQIPLITQFGKTGAVFTSEEGDQELGGLDLDLFSFAGAPTRSVDEEQAATQQRLRRNDERATKRAAEKEKRRLKKTEVKTLYERYLQEP